MAHAREDDTYPLLAEPLGWVPPERVVDVVEAVVTTQRDFGNRDDRHRARLKYLVEERGIEWVRAEVGRRVGFELAPVADQPEWEPEEYHGTRDGVIGLPVPSGKVIDRDGVALRTALREVVADGSVTEIRITARQDLLLFGIAPERIGRRRGPAAGQRRAVGRRRQCAAPPVDRLPGPADVRSGAGRGRAGAARPRHRAREGAGRQRGRRRADPAQHDRLPERVRPAVLGRDRHRRSDEEELRRVRRRLGDRRAAGRAAPRRRPARPDPGPAGAGAGRLRRAGTDGARPTFGDWSHDVGTEGIATWLPEPVVAATGPRSARRRGRPSTATRPVEPGRARRRRARRSGPADRPRRPAARRGRRRRPRRTCRRRRAGSRPGRRPSGSMSASGRDGRCRRS